jgi:hypothetical protein
MKAYGGVEIQLHRSWHLQNAEVGDQIHATDTLPPKNRIPYPLDKMLGVRLSWSGSSGIKKIVFLPGFEPLPSILLPVPIPTPKGTN